MSEVKRLRWKLMQSCLDRVEAIGRWIGGSTPAKWLVRQKGAVVVGRGYSIASGMLLRKIVSPSRRLVDRSICRLRRREVLPWLLTWLLCAILGMMLLLMSIPKIAFIFAILFSVAFLIGSLRSPFTGLMIWLVTSPILGFLLRFKLSQGLPLITWDRMCCASLLVAFLFGSKGKSETESSRTLHWAMALFLLAMLAAGLRGENPRWMMQTAFDVYAVPVIGYLFARRWITTQRSLAILLGVMVAVGAYFCILGIPEHFLGHTLIKPAASIEAELGTVRIQGPASSPTEFGIVVIAAMLLSVAGAATDRRGSRRLLYTVLIALFGLAIALTLRRAVYVALALGLVTMLLGSRPTRKVTGLILAGSILGFVLVWSQFSQSKVYTERIADVSPVYSRLASYNAAWSVIRHHPWIGVGMENYSKYRGRYEVYSPLVSFRYGRGAGVPHNQFLTIFVEGGIVAIIPFIALLFSVIGTSARLLRRAGSTAGLLGRDGVIVFWGLSAAYVAQFVQGDALRYGKFMSLFWFVFLGALAGVYMRRQESLVSEAPPEGASEFAVMSGTAWS